MHKIRGTPQVCFRDSRGSMVGNKVRCVGWGQIMKSLSNSAKKSQSFRWLSKAGSGQLVVGQSLRGQLKGEKVGFWQHLKIFESLLQVAH